MTGPRAETLPGGGGARLGRLAALVGGGGEAARARLFAAAAFAARVANAGLGFVTQILLARWLGEREFGLYATAWVWVITAGGLASFGLPVAALKLVPEYRERGDLAGLRGFLWGARLFGALPAALGCALAAAAGWLWLGGTSPAVPVALLALAILPLYVLTDIQTGIARACDLVDLGLGADYVVRPVLLLAFAAGLLLDGVAGTALVAMAATLAAAALTLAWQGLALRARLGRLVPEGGRRIDLARWRDVSWPLLTVTGFTVLLGATDVIVLSLVAGPEQVAGYFAATKIVAVASFVGYGVANTSAHRFAAHVATGDRAGLERLAAETVRWTFWPTLAVAAALALLARPILSLFGPGFAADAPALAVLALGLVAAAAVGPADRVLAMAEHGRTVAAIYGIAFAASALLCLALVPLLGPLGAALGTSGALLLRSGLLYRGVRRHLGLAMLIGQGAGTPPAPAIRSGPPIESALLAAADLGPVLPGWRDLADRSLDPNVFYDPAVVMAGARHLAGERGVRVLVAWRPEGEDRRVLGVLPLIRCRGARLNPFPIRRAAEFYGTVSTPLVDPEAPEEALRALLQGADRAGLRGILLPFLPSEGGVAQALRRLAWEDGIRVVELASHARPLLKRGLSGADFARTVIDPKRRRKLERQRRRLGEQGRLAFTVARTEAEVGPALERFLDLEASGWKGRLGTALRQDPGAVAFLREMAGDLVRRGRYRVSALSLDGVPVAAALVALAGGRAFYHKIAFDEARSRLSPGILHTLDLSAHLLDDPAVEDTDSLATADHPLYRGIWEERLAMGSWLVSTRPGGGPAFRAALAVERLREEARTRLRPLKARLEARRKARGPAQPAGGDDEG